MEQKKSNGALIGSIIVIVILIAGGIYFWMMKMEPVVIPQEATEDTSAAVNEAYNQLGEIEKDIIATEPEVNAEIKVEDLQ